jgi:hypothetical protein
LVESQFSHNGNRSPLNREIMHGWG